MLLLHLSDIHFQHPQCDGAMDPDRPYRTLLIDDARNRTQALGPVDAILVTGDIAYRGIKEEYDAAFRWLSELANRCGCAPNRIFVVPGNHDVDRNVVRTNPAVRNAQSAIVASTHKESTLRDQFRYIETGRSLLAPLEQYNEFAARFGCQLFPPDRLFWQHPLPLSDGVTLRLHGLNSTILSGIDGGNDTRTTLYLSPLQTVLDPEDAVVNAVLCHHPPDWFLDTDEIEDAVKGRAQLHLFGHKHRQRIQMDDNYVRFSAGAVNPDRRELGWEPGYNLIKLKVLREQARRSLRIETHLLVWQTNPDLFRPKKKSENEEVFLRQMPIRGAISEASAVVNVQPEQTRAAHNAESRIAEKPSHSSNEAVMSNDTRDLIFRFWSLTTSQRREIAQKLDLVSDEDMKLPEAERYGRALIRAKEREQLRDLAREISARERH